MNILSQIQNGSSNRPFLTPKKDQHLKFQGVQANAPLEQDVLDFLDQEVETTETPTALSTERRQELLKELTNYKQIRDIPKNNDPPKRPVGYKNYQVITLPDDYKPAKLRKLSKTAALNRPSQNDIDAISSTNPLSFTVPIQNTDKFSVAENLKSFMDLKKDHQAKRLVAGGLQPSIIGKNWKAIWGIEKVSRDILQNFFDGHNGTIEGTKFEITQNNASGKFNVLITGLGQYDYEKAYLLGGSSKANDKTKAGHYGEGLKVLALNLLRDFGADSVRMASSNWQMTYTMPEPETGEKEKGTPRMFRHLIEVPELSKQESGNILEFTSDNPELIGQLFKALNYFYHPYNPDFTGELIETPYGGIAIYDNEYQKGNVYLSRQRFAYESEDNWEGPLEGISTWTNEKSIEKGRDRTPVQSHELKLILSTVIKELSDTDLVYALKALEPHWKSSDYRRPQNTSQNVAQAIMKEMSEREIATDFDEHYYAGREGSIPSGIQEALIKLGHKILDFQFTLAGATQLTDWHKYFANFKMIEPNANEKQRIKILHKLMLDFVTEIKKNKTFPKNKGSVIEFMDTLKPIYIYDQGELSGSDRLIQGRARFDATWLGNNTLNKPLNEVFNIYAHELMHKHGDDHTEAFSKAFDTYLILMIEIMGLSPSFAKTFKECELLWDESTKKEAVSETMPKVERKRNLRFQRKETLEEIHIESRRFKKSRSYPHQIPEDPLRHEIAMIDSGMTMPKPLMARFNDTPNDLSLSDFIEDIDDREKKS